MPAPGNNDFASATLLTIDSTVADGALTGQTNVSATLETGEPTTVQVFSTLAAGQSVWYKFVAPYTGNIGLSIISPSFDSFLELCTGTSANAYTVINGFEANVVSNAANFSITSGTTYYLRITGNQAQSGTFDLQWTINDRVLQAVSLKSIAGSYTGSAVAHTWTTGEPSIGGYTGSSIWFRVKTGSTGGPAQFDTIGTAALAARDSLISISTQTPPSAVAFIAQNNAQSYSCVVPATAAVGDLLVMAHMSDAQSVAPPSGWTQNAYGQGSGTGSYPATTYIWTKTCVLGDIGSTVTLSPGSGNNFRRTFIGAYRSVSGTPVINSASLFGLGNTATQAAIFAGDGGRVVTALAQVNIGNTYLPTTPSGYTVRLSDNDNSANMQVYDTPAPTNGTVPSQVFSWTNNNNYALLTIAIAPAPAPALSESTLTLLVGDDQSGGNNDAKITPTLLANTDYFIQVVPKNLNSDTPGPYKLNWSIPSVFGVATGQAPVISASSSIIPIIVKGQSPVNVGSSSTSNIVTPILTTTGAAPVVSGSSSVPVMVYITSGISPVNSVSSNNLLIVLIASGQAPVSELASSFTYILVTFEAYPGESAAILIPIELSGIIDPIFPPPVAPVNFIGLTNPTVSPTASKSTTSGGHLLPGTHRYSYAAWKGSQAQATAPSPIIEITISTENTVTLTFPTISGADGYLVYREDL